MFLLERPRLLVATLLCALVLMYPLIFEGGFLLGAGITVGAMAISGTGFVLIFGYAHQIALGHTAFSLIGAYGSAILTARHGWDPFLAMVFSMVVSIFLAGVIAKPILRLRGLIFAMGSIAFQMLLIFIAVEWTSLTGGPEGLPGVPKFAIFGWTMATDRMFYFFVWLLAALSVFVAANIDGSKFGRSLKAISSSEMASESSGIDTVRLKTQVFVLSAAMLSVTGSLLTHFLRLADPHIFGFMYSVYLIVGVITGGLMSVWGGVIGSVVLVALREGLKELGLPALEVVIMGIIVIVVLLLFERGISGYADIFYSRWLERVKSRRKGMPVPSPESRKEFSVASPPSSPGTNPGNGSILMVRNAGKSFGSLKAVDEVSFDIPRHSITSLIGPNGAGKTTMFNLISGHLPLSKGEIFLENRRIDKLHPNQIANEGVARTFQNLHLFHNLTVLENVMCGRNRLTSQNLAAVSFRTPRIAREEKVTFEAARHFLNSVGLGGYESRFPGELSFGHQRLVEIARAMALEPTLLLMDEPASGLNDSETEHLAEILFRIRQNGTTILLVEHDIRLVMGASDHVVVMNYGRKLAEGPTGLIRNDPKVITAYLGGEANGHDA